MTTERIHACLNGEVPPEALSTQEQAQLQEMQAVIGAVAAHLRTYPVPDFTQRVMQALPAPAPVSTAVREPAAWRRLLAWLRTPLQISFTLRPVYALASVLALMLSIPLANEALAPRAERMAVVEQSVKEQVEAPRVYVQFRLEAPEASQVALAGSFTGWQPEYVLQETAPGVWTVLVPLHPGVHDYAFVVDGTHWVVDPHAFQVRDSFGGKNSRLSLPAPRESA